MATTTHDVSGIGLWVDGGNTGDAVTQSGNTFSGNSLADSPNAGDVLGAGELVSAATLTSRNDRWTANSIGAHGTGDAEGAGLAVEGCDNAPVTPLNDRIDNGVIAGNSVTGAAEGAGIYVGCSTGPVKLTMFDTTVSGNSAGSDTAGIWGGGSDLLTVRNSIVTGNTGAADATGFGTRDITFSDFCFSNAAHPGTGNLPATAVGGRRVPATCTRRTPARRSMRARMAMCRAP